MHTPTEKNTGLQCGLLVARDDLRSTGDLLSTGLILYLGSARNNDCLSRSSTESEYKALADTVAKLTWLESLLQELRVPVKSIPILWCDNLGATYLSANPIFHARMKHVEVDFHFVGDKRCPRRPSVQFSSLTHDQIADSLQSRCHRQIL
ncbi:uncharacterized mitochondrial protein-like protein [Tanacetum coccineum]